jgi:hypothetical protein
MIPITIKCGYPGGTAQFVVSLRNQPRDGAQVVLMTHGLDSAKHRAQAEEWCLRGARWLQFMDATGLYPSSICPPMDRPPHSDHAAVWQSNDGALVLTIEPYLREDQIDAAYDDMCRWADGNGYECDMPLDWTGIHKPPMTRMFLFTNNTPIDPISDALDSIRPVLNGWSFEQVKVDDMIEDAEMFERGFVRQ